MKYHFIVQRSAKQWMWMANNRRMRGILRASINQRLKPPRGPVKKQRSDRTVRCVHVSRLTKPDLRPQPSDRRPLHENEFEV